MPKKPIKPKASPKPTPSTAAPRLLYILSDSTGNLARHMLTAFLTQFPPKAFTVRWKPFLQSPQKIADALAEIARAPGIVFHAVVSPEVKLQISQFCKESGAPCCDLTGSFVSFLETHSGLTSSADYNRLHHLDATYHDRIRAMEFTLEHDDGLGLETISGADVVIAGISRTSKTPTSVYLAQMGFRVANVSLAMGLTPPAELLAMPPEKVVGLIIYPETLAEIRTRRNRGWEMGDTAYNDPAMIAEELTWSRRLFQKQRWPILDVTNWAVEETAAHIIEILHLPPPRGGLH